MVKVLNFFSFSCKKFLAFSPQQLAEIERAAAAVVQFDPRSVERMTEDQLDTLVLIPTDERTRALALDGEILAFSGPGVRRDQAERLARAEIKYKRKVAKFVPEALEHVGVILGRKRNPPPPDHLSDWRRSWEAAGVSDRIMGLSEPHKTALVESVAAATAMTWYIR